MNRATRRKLEKQNGQSITMKQYREEAFQEGMQYGIKGTMDMILYMACYTINYKLGFGKKRLCELMNQILVNIDSVRTGQITHEDYMEIQKICNNLGFKMK